MTLMHYIQIVSVRETLERLRWLLEEDQTNPNIIRIDLSRLLERHLKLLLMGENYIGMRIRDTLVKYISQPAAEEMEEIIHDSLLFDVRGYLTLDEDVAVVELTVGHNGDLHMVIEEREVIRRMVDDFDNREYGRHQIEEESVVKMYCD